MSVEMVRLGDVVEKAKNHDPSKKPDELFKYIDLSAIDKDLKLITELKPTLGKDAPSRAKQLVRQNDILVSTVRPNLNGVALLDSADFDNATASTGFCVLRPIPEKLDSRYLFQWVKSAAFIRDMTQKATGANYPAVSDRIIFDSLIPLPPLERQREIAVVLDKVDDLRAKRRQSISKLEELLQSTFLEMFGDPVENPKGWDVRKLGDGIFSVRYGTGSPPNFSLEGFPFIRAMNIKSGRIEEKGMAYISQQEADKIQKCKLKYGNILIVRSGVNSGESAFVSEEFADAYAGYDMIIDLPINWSRYMNYFINSPFGKRIISPMTRRGGQPHLNSAQVQSIPVYDLPVELIDRFSEIIIETEATRHKYLAHLQHLNTLYSSLQAEFFGA